MIRGILVAASLFALAGCMSIIDELYDEHARRECDQAGDQGACYDRVDQHRRERNRDRAN